MTLRQRMRTGKFVVPPIGVHDERQKLTGKCVYCNGPGTSVDHLIPRLAGGPDSADNLVTACKSCNSSKGGRDLYDWASRQEFFPLGVTRRYLVLAWRWCKRAGVLDAPLKELRLLDPPFHTYGLPWRWASVAQLRSQSPTRVGSPARLF